MLIPGGGGHGGGHGGGPRFIPELLENGAPDIVFPQRELDVEFHLSLELDDSCVLQESLAQTFGGAVEALNSLPSTDGCPHVLLLLLSNDLLSKLKINY